MSDVRAPIVLTTVRRQWRRMPFHGGFAGMGAVAMATLVLALACAVIAAVVSLVF